MWSVEAKLGFMTRGSANVPDHHVLAVVVFSISPSLDILLA